MKVVEVIGRIRIVVTGTGRYHLRWWDPDRRKQVSEAAGPDLATARLVAHTRLMAVVRSEDVIERPMDPEFGELWIFYRREKQLTLSERRSGRLDEIWRLYLQPKLSRVPVSRLADAIRSMRNDILAGWTGEGRDLVRNARTKPLSPNTVEEIVNIARAVVSVCIEQGHVKGVDPIPPIKVPGKTAPKDREPKGRHLSFAEIGKLIDACECDHHLTLMLMELGAGVRSGSILDLTLPQIWWHLDAINLQVPGRPQTAKFRPVVPITGPLWWSIPRAALTAGRDGRLLHYRGQGLTGRNGTQIIHRIAARALGRDRAAKVNWYSIRHSLIDFLEMRVPARSLSMLAGHIAALDSKERMSLSRNNGSKTTRLYQRPKLAHLDPIRDVLDAEWWPEIQKHCHLDLRLNDQRALQEWSEAGRIFNATGSQQQGDRAESGSRTRHMWR